MNRKEKELWFLSTDDLLNLLKEVGCDKAREHSYSIYASIRAFKEFRENDKFNKGNYCSDLVIAGITDLISDLRKSAVNMNGKRNIVRDIKIAYILPDEMDSVLKDYLCGKARKTCFGTVYEDMAFKTVASGLNNGLTKEKYDKVIARIKKALLEMKKNIIKVNEFLQSDMFKEKCKKIAELNKKYMDAKHEYDDARKKTLGSLTKALEIMNE